ncbi:MULTISPECIES: ABC transporter permease [unclassified Streptomyces]|uniref:ABC transporter permease n=1 Tax=unclassified Streptomyces TaxID=2593676 RepID=UPI0024735163|nr:MULTISPECIES: ABC transporter permease [unclassified Streptomyces]MDH6453369.1 ABC-2 type transport system permease protein [Streptomyces sp. SAI-119]MDH6496075.1 ABC-2 type transport system permease protein [Streptomyces sp. SAI-149]
MTRTDTAPAALADGTASTPPAERSRHPARPVVLLWRREMIRLRHNPVRLAMGLVTPLLFLVVLGTGLDAASSSLGKAQLNDYRAYLFPGTLVMSVQAPAIAVGISLVWDRRLGVLRQMLVAPFPRAAIIFGLALGGATTGAVYGLMVLSVGGIANIRYTPMLLVVLLELLLVSLMFTSLGLLAAVTIRQVDTFQVAVNLSLMPLMFFSGAMFPPNGLPGWLDTVVKLNPLTYGVDAVRRTLPGPDVLTSEQTRLMLGGWHPPVVAELGMMAALTALALGFAGYRFSRTS